MVFTNFVDTHQRKMFQNHLVPSKKREPRKKFYIGSGNCGGLWLCGWSWKHCSQPAKKKHPCQLSKRPMSIFPGFLLSIKFNFWSLSSLFKLETKALGLGVCHGNVTPSRSLRSLPNLALELCVRLPLPEAERSSSNGPWSKAKGRVPWYQLWEMLSDERETIQWCLCGGGGEDTAFGQSLLRDWVVPLVPK